MNTYKRMTMPRGLIVGTAIAVAFAWALYLLTPQWGLGTPIGTSLVILGLAAVTVVSRRAKVVLVRTVQRWTINPLMKLLLAVGLNPLGLAILETRGRTSGKIRRTPVGDGRKGQDDWIIAEHGERANYVRNIRHDPRVRLRLRQGLRYRWVTGLATVLPLDDVLARQRQVIRWHPLRALNAMNVRVLGADLVTVHVRLLPTEARLDPAR